jgi:uncharacterized membrane protein YvlD (DUF360 family)
VPSSVEGGPPEGGRRPARWRMTARDVRDALLGVLPTAVALLLASWVLPGLHLTAWAAVVAAVVVSVADALVRPLLRWIAGRLGAVVALLLGLAVQLVVVQAALAAAPGTYADTVGTAAATLVLVAILGAVGRWMLGRPTASTWWPISSGGPGDGAVAPGRRVDRPTRRASSWCRSTACRTPF